MQFTESPLHRNAREIHSAQSDWYLITNFSLSLSSLSSCQKVRYDFETQVSTYLASSKKRFQSKQKAEGNLHFTSFRSTSFACVLKAPQKQQLTSPHFRPIIHSEWKFAPNHPARQDKKREDDNPHLSTVCHRLSHSNRTGISRASPHETWSLPRSPSTTQRRVRNGPLPSLQSPVQDRSCLCSARTSSHGEWRNLRNGGTGAGTHGSGLEWWQSWKWWQT